MTSVFISSVIGGFEDFRKAAKSAVDLLGYRPVMSEEFGARPYSSEIACLAEVEKSDVYLLILGERYGFTTNDGLSVTQSEFRTARGLDKPILVFVQRSEMDHPQREFKKEVEDYHGGFFRDSFSTPDELKDAVVKGLRQLEVKTSAIAVGEFEARVATAIKALGSKRDAWVDSPELVLSFLPQPHRSVDVVALESQLDAQFNAMSQAGLVALREGYAPLLKSDFTGLETGNVCAATFVDGLIVLRANPVAKNGGILDGHFVLPEKVAGVAAGFRSLIKYNLGYMQLLLRNMGNAYVAKYPGGNSITMKMFGEKEVAFSHFFGPLTDASYRTWTQQCVGRLERVFAYGK